MFATPWNTDDRTVGLRTLAQAPDGVTFAYEVLEQVATGLEAGDAWMVVKPPGMGSQVFGRPGRMLAPPVAGALADRPAGIYVAPAPGGLVADGGLVQVAEVLLGADHARRTSAVDARSGLATSWALDMALERATACAARYGWPCTVVVLSTAGDADGASRFDALCGALRAALRSGDEAGVARAGEVVAILGSAGTDVVRPFVGRVRAAMNAGGASDADLLVGAARAPDESVDPAEILRLAGERLASEREAAGAEPGAARGEPEAAGGEPGTSAEGGGSAALELELRSLPGVIGVQRGDGQRLTVLVRGAEEDLRSRARLALARRGLSALREAAPTEASDPLTMLDVSVVRVPERPGLEVVPDVQDLSAGSTEPGAGGADAAVLAGNGKWGKTSVLPPLLSATAPRSHEAQIAPGPASVGAGAPEAANGAPSSPPPAASPRVEAPRAVLLATSFRRDEGISEVSVALGPARGTGRAPAGPLAGGAQATLGALAELGAPVPFYVASCERARTVPCEPVVVVLAPCDGAGASERVGVASGDDDLETASRATLAALNRYLARPRPLPGA